MSADVMKLQYGELTSVSDCVKVLIICLLFFAEMFHNSELDGRKIEVRLDRLSSQ